MTSIRLAHSIDNMRKPPEADLRATEAASSTDVYAPSCAARSGRLGRPSASGFPADRRTSRRVPRRTVVLYTLGDRADAADCTRCRSPRVADAAAVSTR